MSLRHLRVLATMQGALLGEVSAKLRVVTVTFTDTSVFFKAYFDGPIDELDSESMSLAETHLIAAFPETHVIGHETISLDFPHLISTKEPWVYARREDELGDTYELLKAL